MIKLSIIILLVILNLNAFCQVDEDIIDPIFIPCYNLKNDKKIEPIILNGNYSGKILIAASCDTVKLKLKDFKIKFAKLFSNIDAADSIEIRLEDKRGNYNFLDDNMSKIISKIEPMELVKTDVHCDYVPEFNIPIKIVSNIK